MQICGNEVMLKNFPCNTVDGSEILYQLRLVVVPIIYKILYIPGGCFGFLQSTVVHEVWVGVIFHDPCSFQAFSVEKAGNP